MKLKKVAAICKKSQNVTLFERTLEDGTVQQYVSNLCVVYPLFGLPALEMNSLFTIFDVSEKEAEKIAFKSDELPDSIDMRDCTENEFLLDPPQFTINISGIEYIPLKVKNGMVFIKTAYIAPIQGESEMMEMWARYQPSGKPYIVIKAGMILLCAIMPAQPLSLHAIEHLETMAVVCREEWDLRKEEE